VSDSLEARVKRIEDREAISECVIRYAMSLDKADWDLFKDTVADPIFVDFTSWAGLEARDYSREEWAGFARDVLSGFDARQHLSPNHVITFESDDEATCTSYMFAQHLLRGAPGGDTLIMRGSYTNVLQRRASGGWEIKSMTQHFGWGEGNEEIFETSQERFKEGSDA
jgi:ketosteroid isomerase-like protein